MGGCFFLADSAFTIFPLIFPLNYLFVVSSVPTFPTPHSHPQCFNYQSPIHLAVHGPTDNLTGKQVKYHGKVQPALTGPDIGDIRNISRVRLSGLEFTIQQVWCNWQGVLTVSGNFEFHLLSGSNISKFHYRCCFGSPAWILVAVISSAIRTCAISSL